ncbi:MAG: hypothetical protein HY368_02330 [Candidatus Aenigmarchaeota archaeon]|nr:hypothetical protein [Candidatus Aenigmarchaeota archaeon]
MNRRYSDDEIIQRFGTELHRRVGRGEHPIDAYVKTMFAFYQRYPRPREDWDKLEGAIRTRYNPVGKTMAEFLRRVKAYECPSEIASQKIVSRNRRHTPKVR